MRTADFHYELPPGLIAQHPATERDQSRLLVLHRQAGRLEHRRFRDLLGYVRPGDALVFNNSRVLPARLRATKKTGAGRVEILLLEENETNDWWCLARPGKRVRVGATLALWAGGQSTGIEAEVVEKNPAGHCRLRFSGATNLADHLDALGEVPLPPYISRDGNVSSPEDRARYQTVYARPPGSVAAPTAGLHFTDPLLEAFRARGVRLGFVTLHVGLGTFAPVRSDHVEQHELHAERFVLDAGTAHLINETKHTGGRVVAVGTTTVRVLETVAARHPDALVETRGHTRMFIHPPFAFRIVDALVTNFHLPESTLLMLVSAFATPGELGGRELVLSAYAEAVRERYRFYSYGDAMLLL